MIYKVNDAQGLRMACKGIIGTQYPMQNGQLWQFDGIRIIVHYSEDGMPKREIQNLLNIDTEVTIGALTSHYMNLQGVEMEARLVNVESKEEYFRELEPFLMKIGMK